MFHMMNEARIGVGMGAVMYGYRGYLASLQYARERLQGRPPAAKDPLQPQVPLVAHADVRRMLLAQKAYVEGAFALGLYAARLVDEQRTGTSEAARAEAGLLLDLLTPIVKSWPAQWCLEANSLAIQIHGGYGYTREYPVEQFWRDNRLNMIHEGTHGIQALDLLGRKDGQEGVWRAGTGGFCAAAHGCPAAGGRGHPGRLGGRRAHAGAGQCRALYAGLWPHGAGLDLARRGAHGAESGCYPINSCKRRQNRRYAVFFPL
jgi:hypothetical protein